MDRLDARILRQSDLLLARDVDSDLLRRLQRAHGAGNTRRLRRGVYAPSEMWAGATDHSMHLIRMLAVNETHHRPLFGHVSAAAAWGLPLANTRWPAQVHLVTRPDSHARSKNGVVVHRQAVGEADLVERSGLLLTSFERTVIDIARTVRFPVAVAALDYALSQKRAGELVLTRERLIESLDRSPHTNGRARARRAIAAARDGADNPGETLSRLTIVRLGFVEPLLQVAHINPRGGFYFTDHEWPESGAIAEFDGFGKYLKAARQSGDQAGRAVYEEKIREDHLRDEGNRLTRWGPPELRNPGEIARRLLRIGVPRVQPPGQRGRKLLEATDVAG